MRVKKALWRRQRDNGDAFYDLVPFLQSKNVKKTRRAVLHLLKLQALVCNFTKSNIPPWVFFTFFKLNK